MKPALYTYFRSSCSFRIRIALALKKIDYESRFINLHPNVKAQLSASYLDINPQARVPYYVDENIELGQSVAILEYVNECVAEPALLPSDPVDRAHVRQLVQLIACDVQPLNNASVLGYLRDAFDADDKRVNAWYHHWIHKGFSVVEALLECRNTKHFCYAETVSMADVVLIPQVWNALRFNVPLQNYPRIKQIYDHCMRLDEFKTAAPEVQSDAQS